MSENNNYKPVVYIGIDAMELGLAGLSDEQVLEAVHKAAPQGVQLRVGDYGPVWLHAGVLRGSAHLDGFGLETMGLVKTAVDLLRLADDAEWATELGETHAKRLLRSLVGQATERASSKRGNQLHAVRFGVSAKVVLADRVEPGTFEIHPEGNVAKRLLQVAIDAGTLPEDAETYDLEGTEWIDERHPFQLCGVSQCVLNDNLTKNLILCNRIEFRARNRGDADGDTINLFSIPSHKLAGELRRELASAIARTGRCLDAALHVRGTAITEDADTWAENIYAEGKTVEKKMTQTFVMTCDEWLAKHETMAEYANKYTPFAYRISDIGASMAGLGEEGAREVALMGAVIEEDFYLGLSGGPKGLDEAMETWYREKMIEKNRKIVLDGLRKVVRPDLLTTPVKLALLEAARINQTRIDIADPVDVFTHMGWLIGKGLTTIGKPNKSAPSIANVLNGINAIAGSPEVIAGSTRFLVQVSTYAAAMLAPVLAAKTSLPDDDGYGDERDGQASSGADADLSDYVGF